MTADFFLVCVRMVARAVHVFFSFMRIHYLRSKFYRNVFCAENTNHHFRFIAKKKIRAEPTFQIYDFRLLFIQSHYTRRNRIFVRCYYLSQFTCKWGKKLNGNDVECKF